MRIARIVGTLTCNQLHPSLQGGTFKLAVPLTLVDLMADADGGAEELVVYDEMGVGLGQQIMLSEGGEAAQPFYPELKPVDAYNAGIIDRLHVDAQAARQIELS
ncbi:MAG: EutN/CcmL family microcompartment protein [Pirellulales bacterium]